ncbi:hypothetical protein B0H14DRAFT_2645538 [Mycena olivaceomarginata]|nr:hypothetical protein B0H14DRAFT_2645538 [Mycena olivaceomarginata]
MAGGPRLLCLGSGWLPCLYAGHPFDSGSSRFSWTIELIASVKARAIPAASDVFGRLLLILSHPTGTQVGSHRLDSGGTASAARTPVRFGVEPSFLNCASGVPPGSCMKLRVNGPFVHWQQGRTIYTSL